jgi:glycine/D-amino acid oxidase-like deaminating enzyme
MRPTMDRRALLKLLGTAALGTAAPACTVRRPSPAGARRRLGKVHARDDRVIRDVVGLRPYRPSGFVVRAERVGDKTIVHNYGHGGGGVTLSWGTAQLALEEAAATGQRRAAVLGAGAVGLATAVLFQRAGWDIAVYAKDLPPATTSNVSGAQWSPSGVYDVSAATPAFDTQFERACRIAYRRFQDLPGARYGIRWIETYEISESPFSERGHRGRTSAIRDLYPELSELPSRESPFDYPHVRRFSTMLIEPPAYLDALLHDVLSLGGRVEVRELRSREEVLALPEPVVVNCTGLGSKALFGDEELVPVQGQLSVLLPQPEIDYIALAGELYMFPRADGIVLGSTYRTGAWDFEVDTSARAAILSGIAGVMSHLKG